MAKLSGRRKVAGGGLSVAVGLAVMTASFLSHANEGAKPASLSTIMSGLASVKGADATFLETRDSAFLTSGLKSNGRVIWRAPASLTKHTLEPFEETVSVKDGEIKLSRTDDGRTRGSTISIDDHPELRSIVESVRSTLAGDSGELENNFSVEVGGNTSEWTIELKPVSKKLSKTIESIQIAGSGQKISEFQTRETDGDVSTMTLTYLKIW